MSEERGSAGSSLRIEDLDEAGIGIRLSGVELSSWFDPFLVAFAREAIACGGRVAVARRADSVDGLLLTDPGERVASVFSRSRTVAAALDREVPELAVYSEHDPGAPTERFRIHAVELGREPPHRFLHSPRLLADSEMAEARALLREVYGGAVDRWASVAPAFGERCLGVDVDGTLAGVAWVLVAGRSARLHALTVRPGFRGVGIGTDLLFARLLLARRAGAVRAVSEIAERNLPSVAVATKGGMRPCAELFLHLKPAPADPKRGPGPARETEPPTSA